jgi:RimJ/RimL family protein N-acetyltransferase
MVRLDPMTQAEFEAYVEFLVHEYAQDHVDAGNWRAEEALELARESTRHLLPDGLETEDHYLCTLRDATLGETVGVVWFAAERRQGGPRAFVYDLWIEEAYRRRGYATQALGALEARVQELGLPKIVLHVFGHNHAARSLYAKAGFEEVDLILAKTLSS